MPGQAEKLTVEIFVKSEKLLGVPAGIGVRLASQDSAEAGDASFLHPNLPQGCALDGLPNELSVRDAFQIH